MPLVSRSTYKKSKPFRDATIYILVCEGEKREPEYFNEFKERSPKLKIVTIPSKKGKSAPNHLIENAVNAEVQEVSDQGDYEIWFILDVDKWEKGIHELFTEVKKHKQWNLTLSNPCFEVWLYYHFEMKNPQIKNKKKCKSWKEHLFEVSNDGFHSKRDHIFIDKAVKNSKNNYSETGYIPDLGSTQLYRLGEKIVHLINPSLNP